MRAHGMLQVTSSGSRIRIVEASLEKVDDWISWEDRSSSFSYPRFINRAFALAQGALYNLV